MKNGFSIAEYPNDRLLVQNLHTTNLREKNTKKIVSNGCKQRHEYNVSCQKRGIKERVTTIKKGEPTTKPTSYPTISQLVRGCSMEPSPNHQYWVKKLKLDHVTVELRKTSKSFLADENIS